MRAVFWSSEARQDYLDILHYIARENPNAAERVVDAIEVAGNDLGKRATGRPGRVGGTYEKSVLRLPYIIAYALAEHGGQDSVVILRVIHTSRNWPSQDWPE